MDADVTVVGYCEPVSLHPGDRVDLKLSSSRPGPLTIDVVEVVCGDPANPAMGLVEREVAVPGFPLTIEGTPQSLHPGSSARFGPHPTLAALDRFTLTLAAKPYLRPDNRQEVLRFGGLRLWWGRQGFDLGGESTGPLQARRWYELRLQVDRAQGRSHLTVAAVATHSPGVDSTSQGGSVEGSIDQGDNDTMVVGAGYDGRVARLRIEGTDPGGTELRFDWDASLDMAGDRWIDRGPAACHGVFDQLPARGVRSDIWDGSSRDPATAPEGHYDAVHFHTSDLYDAGWATSASLSVPENLSSGIYCFRTRSDHGSDRTPFFVAAPPGSERPAVAYLVPVATYLAYANQRIHLTNAEFFAGGAPPPANHRWLADNPGVGYSTYEYHPDRSGVMFSSRRRPVMNLKPGADGWGFTPDTNITAFLHHLGEPFDVVTDEQLHEAGPAALEGYRVIVTGSHPEYWSTPMLDTLETWQRNGGRLMYLGGNGFYWRVAFSATWPGALEVRRAEDGTRAWIAEVGEYHHAFGGEYGGLWRRHGRAPNMICGVGFAAQGFGRAAPYQRTHLEPERTDWIFDGVQSDVVGAHGVGGGAAGQEIDRFDPNLGSPDHAVVVATATDHDPSMLRTKEEFHVTVSDASAMSAVRADMVFYEIAGGGAVFSTGSIAWFGALATDGYDNDVARITANVLRRFADPAPFAPPTG